MRGPSVRRLLAVAAGFVCVSTVAHAQGQSECLVSLAATGGNATSSRAGRMVTATADSSGFCTFTLSACVNDTSAPSCSAAQVDQVRILGGSGLDLSSVQQSLQSQLPTNQHACTQVLVKLGQTLHRKIHAEAVGANGRRDADTLTLVCQCASPGSTFSSTFQGIQTVIFNGHGCTQQACHSGPTPQGGLDLSPGVAYKNLLQVPATDDPSFQRVRPGAYSSSYLWLKLAYATDPSQLPMGFHPAGSPMPLGLTPLSATELQAVQQWIFAGAPQTGTVGGTETLLNACLPPPEPITITPLNPPPAGEGIQFVMPPWHLEAHSEHEICFATYYDLSSQVPTEFQDPSGTMFRFSGVELRQDPQSHHLILNRSIGSADMVHDPSFGAWACNGGPNAGQTCEPTDLTSCGTGTCTSQIQQSFACLGFGPQGDGGATFYAIGGAQKAQDNTEFVDGVFAQIPMKGILYWNSHAFNLTDQDTVMHARLNYYFAKDQTYPVQGIFDTSKIFAANAPPYTTQTVCDNFVLPQGARLFSLSSHTHKHGKHFNISTTPWTCNGGPKAGQTCQPTDATSCGTGTCGTPLYDSFVYNDPVTQTFDPPLAFDSPDQAQRTLHYCSLYNNGVTQDGSPDPTLVTRYSLIPSSAKASIGLCTPSACAAGQVGKRCRGVGDDRTCDSAPGAKDGSCDACPLTGGESTQNEMFILIGDYYLPGAATSVPSNPLIVTGGKQRSMSTDIILPPLTGCSAAHGGHAQHAGHGTAHASHRE